MKNWIRWQGLLAFVVVVGAIIALWLLFVDGMVSRLIEKTGTAIVGAEVDVKAHVKLFPLGITLRDLEVTNPQAPDTNSLECGRIAFNLDTLNLFRRKVIINEMAMEGIRFDTKRKRPGTVRQKIEEKKTGGKSALALSMEKPDVKKILQTESLESVRLIESTQTDLKKKDTEWQKRIEELPNKAKIDAYRDRIDKIKKTKQSVLGIAGQVGEVRNLKQDIEKDLERVKQAGTAFSSDLASAKTLVDRAEQSPLNDVRKLRDKYSISPAGLSNMTQVLFGERIASWARTGLLWYRRVQPIVERVQAAGPQKKDVAVVKPLRGKGVDVRFKEYRPLPDFLIGRAAVSAETKAGMLSGTIRNITPDQNVLGTPLTYALKGEKLSAAKAVAITGALDHIRPDKPEDTAHAVVQGYRLQNLVLSDEKELPVSLQDALVDFDLNVARTQTLKARLTATINSARLNVGAGGSDNFFAAAVRSALSKVSRFSISADLAGTLDNYTVNVSSDLDGVLKNAVGSVVAEQSAKLERELKAAIQEKTGGQLKALQTAYGGLNQKGSALTAIQGQLSSLLQDAAKSAGGGLPFP